MCYEEIPCPDCSSLNVVKNGKTAQQKQRYLCKDCRRQFIRAYTYLGCSEAVRAQIVPLTMNGAGIRDIERVLLVSRHTVPRRVRALELDEFWSFVRSKKQQRWTWLAFDRVRRTDAACQQLLKQLADCQVSRYYTDEWQSYKKFLPTKQHEVGKEQTRHIERHNLNFRTHLKRLQRRTICYSKTAEMHDAVLKLYIQHSNAGHHHL